ncbi:hypothetical protein HanXRQr2_Chr04g0167701 [Helianthus annuus]|uniref:Zinc finger, CCHC-type n=1 Tax=Helianthus annuus TaxID=4232 RepID=A0A9K3NRX1_HELAN|nr:hypothetical protein HanXRQr2_Chr04g0167701 [Helianthus annuus]
MMTSLLHQAVKEDILVLLQHNGSAYSIWKALKSKFVGSKEMIKNKKSLMRKEFDLFRGLRTESTKQIIERYCNLIVNMKRLSITKDNEELIEKLADALPHETWGAYLMMLRNKKDFGNLTLGKFIEKLEAQEMEQRKISRMKDFDGEQDIGLYYKGGINDKTNMSPKIKTAFNAKSSSGGSSQGSSSKIGFSSYPSFDPNFSKTKNGKVLQYNIALNLENDQNYSEEVAKSHMSLLVTVLESYGSLVAGRIGNPMLTKEDYDQIDAEEMELMDIKWCMASVLRRADKFKQITGRDDFRGKKDTSRESVQTAKQVELKIRSATMIIIGKQYHQVAQQQQEPQTAHAKKAIEESSKKAYLMNKLIDQDDEKLPEGFSWENFSWDTYCPDKEVVKAKAFVARVAEDSDNDDDYYANRMKEHLRMLEESDSDDGKVRKKKKKVKKQVSSGDEEVRVIKKKVKEVPAFKVEAEADA